MRVSGHYRFVRFPCTSAINLNNLANRPFLKSNSRLRMPGRAGSTISSARFLSPSLTLQLLGFSAPSTGKACGAFPLTLASLGCALGLPPLGCGTRCKTAKDAVFQLKTSSPSRLTAHQSFPSQEGTRVTPAMQRFRKRFRLVSHSVLCFEKRCIRSG